jgi:RNA polymerase sigma-70 factor (ECF subfamily)
VSSSVARPVPAEEQRLGPSSDEELLSRYRDSRRPECFAENHRRYSGELGRYLVRYLGDTAQAEDALQEKFLRVHTKCGLYRDGWPDRPWIYAVAIHRAVDAQRRWRPSNPLDRPVAEHEPTDPATVLESLADDEPGLLEDLQQRERQLWVQDSVTQLPRPMRQVLVLAYDRELSYAEIAGLLGVPLGTVKSRLHVAIARLRAMAQRQVWMGSN